GLVGVRRDVGVVVAFDGQARLGVDLDTEQLTFGDLGAAAVLLRHHTEDLVAVHPEEHADAGDTPREGGTDDAEGSGVEISKHGATLATGSAHGHFGPDVFSVRSGGSDRP